MTEQPVQRRWMPIITIGIVLLSAGVIGSTITRAWTQQSTPEVVSSVEFPIDTSADPSAETAFGELEPTSEIAQPDDQSSLAQSPPVMVVVYISGAVAYPGTYQLTPDARINDVVELAGGLTTSADRNRINLAERIRDEQHIHIPAVGEAVAPTPSNGHAAKGNDLLDINSASAQEFEALDGIGQVLAQRIVEWRDNEGLFHSVEDLQQVKGITVSIYNKIKDKVTVN